MIKKIVLILSVLLTAVIFNSCSDRGVTSVDEVYNKGMVYDVQHLMTHYLKQSMFRTISENPLIRFKVYRPYKDDTLAVPGPSLPVLYLLSPFGEDEFYYFNSGLKTLADRMISSGEIKPMIIVCVNGSNGYGGSFYGNTYAGGKYADIIGSRTGVPISDSMYTLLDYIDGNFNPLTEPTQRANTAISGVGMGGYGALRIAMQYSQNFGSVSAVTGPLDFDGATGSSGFLTLFQQLMAIVGPTNYRSLDTSSQYPIRTMLISAATSFSPHDTGTTRDGLVITDMATFFAPGGLGLAIQYHLPFDSTGSPYSLIWNMWMDNNLANILTQNPTSLDNTSIMILNNPEGDFGFPEQTLSFHNYLTSLSKTHTYEEITGYEGYPATDGRYTYEALKKILKYHSDHFVIPE